MQTLDFTDNNNVLLKCKFLKKWQIEIHVHKKKEFFSNLLIQTVWASLYLLEKNHFPKILMVIIDLFVLIFFIDLFINFIDC